MNLAAAIDFYAYGTSEGVEKAWDTRGRGRQQSGYTRLKESEIPDKLYVGLSSEYYHGFPGMKTKPVKAFGIDPAVHTQFQKSSENYVYLARTPGLAGAYANLYAKPAVLEISTAKLDKKQFYSDPLDVPVGGLKMQFAYKGHISPGAISILRDTNT